MAASKRKAAEMDEDQRSTHVSSFIANFEFFRSELDEHHDRRERIIKASRDITAQSKKVYVQHLFATSIDLFQNLRTAKVRLIWSVRERG